MAQEILYTSAEKGLKPGSRGFCTVISSEGMAKNVAERLEGLSGYRHVFGIHDANREWNPVNWAHTTTRIGGKNWHVLSRVADAGQDYSGRTNKLAHHIALERSEQQPAGPARLLADNDVVYEEWNGDVGIVPQRCLQQVAEPRSADCSNWKQMTGDAGWAGQVAEELKSERTTASIIFPVDTPDTLALVIEVLDLLPAQKRWGITFSTYFTQLVPGTECRLRFVLDGTSEATALRNNPHAFVVDLCADLPPAEGGELVTAARTGQLPASAVPADPTPKSDKPRRLGEPKREPAADSDEDDFDFAPADEDEFEEQEIESEEGGTYALQKERTGASARPRRQPAGGRTPKRQHAPTGGSNKRVLLIVLSCLAGVFLMVAAVGGAFLLGRQSNAPQQADSGTEIAQSEQLTFQPLTSPGISDASLSGSPTDPSENPEPPSDPTKNSVAGAPRIASADASESQGNTEDGANPRATAESVAQAVKTTTNDKTTTDNEGNHKKPADSETPERKGPFESLPGLKAGVALLELPPLGGESQPWALNTTDVSVELLGGGLLFNKPDEQTQNGFKCVAGSSDGTWLIELIEAAAIGTPTTTPVAELSLKPADDGTSSLQFSWHANAGASAQSLWWTLLRLTSSGQSVVCKLSRPKVDYAIALNSVERETEYGIPFEKIGLEKNGVFPLQWSFSLIGELPAQVHSEGTKHVFVVPLRDGPFKADRDPCVIVTITSNLNEGKDAVEFSVEKHFRLNLYEEKTLKDHFPKYKGEGLPAYGKDTMLTETTEKKLKQRLVENKWTNVIEWLENYKLTAAQVLDSAKRKAKEEPQNQQAQNAVAASTAAVAAVQAQLDRHKKNKFEDIFARWSKVKSQIAASSIALTFSLQINEGGREHQIGVLEAKQ